MLVFLSWSGNRSRLLAEAFAKWLGQVIQAVEPWISIDIDKGARWGPEIAEKLEKSKIGIMCLTPENLESRWILFEAGALSKTKDAYVCTLLLKLTPAEVEPPLGQFQHTLAEKADIARLVRTVNSAVLRVGERSLPDSVLNDVFETFWPQLAEKLAEIAAIEVQATTPARSQTDILDEILSTVRNLERREAAGGFEPIIRPRHRAIYKWNANLGSPQMLVLEEPLDPRELKLLSDFVSHLRTWRNAKTETSGEPQESKVQIDDAT